MIRELGKMILAIAYLLLIIALVIVLLYPGNVLPLFLITGALVLWGMAAAILKGI